MPDAIPVLEPGWTDLAEIRQTEQWWLHQQHNRPIARERVVEPQSVADGR